MKSNNNFTHLNNSDIQEEDLTFNSGYCLSQGLFGAVYQGKWLRQNVAVKKINEESNQQAFEREISLVKTLHHPCIVSSYGFVVKAMQIYFVMELLERGDLYDQIYSPDLKFCNERRCGILVDILSGLTYLEQRGVVHNDIRTANIFLTKNWRAKIGDFGLANITEEEYTNFFSTRKWRNPDSLSSHKVDVYGFGLILWSLAHDRNVKESDAPFLPLTVPLDASSKIACILECCLSLDAEQRPAARQLLTKLQDEVTNQVAVPFSDKLKFS